MIDKHPDEDEDLIQILPDETQPGVDVEGEPEPAGGKAKEPVVAEPATKKGKDAALNADDAFDALKKDVEEANARSDANARKAADAERKAETERQARVKAEEFAATAGDTSLRDRWDKVNTNKSLLDNALASTNRHIEQARRELKAAVDAGNSDAVVSLTENLADLKSDLRDLTHGSQAAEAEVKAEERRILSIREKQKQAAEAKPTPEPEQPKQSPDDWISTIRSNVGSKPADWLSEHKDFVTDGKKHQQLLKFSDYYASKGKPLNSNDFIQALNDEFFPEDTDMADPDDEPEVIETPTKTTQTRKSAPTAPVSRSASPSQSSSSAAGTIQLSKDEYAAAPEVINAFEDLDPDLQTKFKQWSPTAARFQYDRNKKRAMKDNKFRI